MNNELSIKHYNVEQYIKNIAEQLNKEKQGTISDETLKRGIDEFTSPKYDSYTEEQIYKEINGIIQKMLEERELRKQEFLKKQQEIKQAKFEELRKLYLETKEKYQNLDYSVVQTMNMEHMQSYNETKKVQLLNQMGETLYGFYKGESSPNEYELLVSRLGKICGVPVADYSLYLDNGTLDGISISCIPDEEKYDFLSGYDFVKMYPEVSEVVSRIKNNPEQPKPKLSREQTKYYMDILLKGFAEKVKNPEQLEQLKKDYFKAVLFNAILDQKDFNYTNFAVLYDKVNDSYQMAPLFDNGAVKINDSLEGTYITTLGRSKKDDVINLLFTDYYDYVSDFAKQLVLENVKQNNGEANMITSMMTCIDDTITHNAATSYKQIVQSTLQKVIEIENKKLKNNDQKDYLNKVIKNVLGDNLPQELIDKKIAEYLTSNSTIDMASFLYNDLNRFVSSKNIDKKDEIGELVSKSFGFTKEQLVENAKKVIDNNIKPGQMPIEENHKLVHDTLIKLCDKLTNNNIDYYLVGALPCYLLTGEKDERYHDDIDLMLNEVDIPKVQKLLEGTDFDFKDKRLDTPKRQKPGQLRPGGDHEVMAQHKTSEFHLGFFCFERGKDGEVIHKDYFKDENGELKVYKHMITPEESKLDFDDTLHTYGGTQFKMGSLESTYSIKKSTMNNPGREKDATDVRMIEKSGKLNLDKIKARRALPHLQPVIESVDVNKILNSSKQEKAKVDNIQSVPRPVAQQTQEQPKITELFDQRSQSEIQDYNQKKEENQVIKQQKKQQNQMNKTVVRTRQPSPNNTGTDNKGYVNVIILSLIVSFVCGSLSMVVYMLLKG